MSFLKQGVGEFNKVIRNGILITNGKTTFMEITSNYPWFWMIIGCIIAIIVMIATITLAKICNNKQNRKARTVCLSGTGIGSIVEKADSLGSDDADKKIEEPLIGIKPSSDSNIHVSTGGNTVDVTMDMKIQVCSHKSSFEIIAKDN